MKWAYVQAFIVPKLPEPDDWTRVAAVGESGEVFGVRIFDYEWTRTGRSVEIHDPLYAQWQPCTLNIYQVDIGGVIHTFAAGEFCNGGWGFYVPPGRPSINQSCSVG